MANFNIDYLVIAGGASGANQHGGGGGAGGLRTSYGSTSGGGASAEPTLSLTTGTSYSLTVGDGGAGVTWVGANLAGNNGYDSVFNNITSIGGGGGSSYATQTIPSSGGSGGGGGSQAVSAQTGASGEPGQGYAGGSGFTGGTPYPGGGGGGAGGLGGNATTGVGGNGGDGLQNDITVTTTGTGPYYAGGGGSATYGSGTPGTGGSGIGGAGKYTNSNGNPGNPQTGSGGGGTNGGFPSGSGGSGIVILRYATADVASYTTTGLTPTEDTTTISGQTILSFTTVGTGTITFTTPTPPTFSGTKVTTPVTDFNKTNTEEGLKIPSGTSSNQPTGFGSYTVDGMVRNDTTQSSNGSSSAITYYNGTNWRYFAATKSVDPLNPLILSSVMYYSASDTTSYPGSGTDWFDLSGNSNTATITSSNYSNGYFDLTPTASIITTPVNTLYQTFSYSIWVKFDSVTPASGYVFTMLSKNQFYASNYQAFPFYAAVAPTGTFTSNLSYGNDYSPDVTNSTSVSANTWYNIACVIDTTTNTSKLYIGTESTQLALVNSVSYTGTLVDSRNEFYSLGKAPAERSGGVGKSSMDGKIAKFGFWDTALTEAELITIWGLGSGAT
jgi:hypothetical protein